MNFREMAQEQIGGFNEELHEDKIREIGIFYRLLNEYFIEQISDSAVSPEELPASPFVKFEAYLKECLKERGLEVELNDYLAFHYAKGGSTPQFSRTKDFDLEGDLIRLKFKEFVMTQYPELFEEVE